MRRDTSVDPAWLEWAEQQTIKLLRAQLEERRAARRPEPPSADPIRVVHEIERDGPGDRELDLAGPEVRVAARSDGLVIRIHRTNV